MRTQSGNAYSKPYYSGQRGRGKGSAGTSSPALEVPKQHRYATRRAPDASSSPEPSPDLHDMNNLNDLNDLGPAFAPLPVTSSGRANGSGQADGAMPPPRPRAKAEVTTFGGGAFFLFHLL